MMKERPILFSGAMVRAILRGENPKTQTRRECSTQRDHFCDFNGLGNAVFTNDEKTYTELKCPYGQAGDRLWVRETTCLAPKNFATPDDSCVKDYDGDLRYVSYKADGHSEEAMRDYQLKWTPSIHVPRWASRILLEVVSVRVERLQAISEADAIAEGIEGKDSERWPGRKVWRDYQAKEEEVGPDGEWFERARDSYRSLWESINGPGSWEENPWVWGVEFRRVLPV